MYVQLLRLSVCSCALAALDPVKPFTISVPLTCKHSDRSRLVRDDTDRRSARPVDDTKASL